MKVKGDPDQYGLQCKADSIVLMERGSRMGWSVAFLSHVQRPTYRGRCYF